MEFRQLYYMLKVAEERSFSKAAQKLYITQPSLSQYILNLENQLGVQLFDRTTHPLKLTYAGEVFAERSRNLLNLQKELSDEMKDLAETKRGRLTLGISPIRGTYLLPKVLPPFNMAYPGIDLKLIEGTSAELEDWLLKGVTDLAVMSLPILSDEISYEVIEIEELLIAIPPNHPVRSKAKKNPADKYPSISLSWLKDDPFILLHHGQGMRQIADDLFKQAGFKPNIFLETKSLETANALVAAGVGVTFAMASTGWFTTNSEQPMFYSLDHPVPTRTLVAAFKKGTYFSNIAAAFIEQTKQVLHDHDKQKSDSL